MVEKSLDSISSLPEDILRRVVSFIPLKEAVRTCILSTTWRSLWAPLHVQKDEEEVTQAIGTFLRSYNNHEIRKISHEKSSLNISASKGVDKELHLEFSEEKLVKGNFSLKLEILCRSHCNHPMEMMNFASLRTLHLRSVTGLSEGMVAALFARCQLLHSLKLEICVGLECLDIKAGDSLKSLRVVNCPEIASISVYAPNLKSFLYQGALPFIQLQNSPGLVDAVLDIRDGPGHNEFDCEEILPLLAALKNVEILTLSGWLLEWLCSAGVIFRRLEFRFNKLKELWWTESSMDRAKRDSLAYFLDICPSLERLFIDIDPRRKTITCPLFHHFWHEPHFWMDYSTSKPSHSQHQCLKIIEIRGFTNLEEELLTMDVLLKKTVTLKSMVVTSPENGSCFVVKVPSSQLKSTLGSFKYVSFLAQNEEFFFGFMESRRGLVSST